MEKVSGMDPGMLEKTGQKLFTPGTPVSLPLLSTLTVCFDSSSHCLSHWKSNQCISICRLLDASPSHVCSQLVLLLQRKGDNIMNTSILWNTVLIELFAAVAAIGLREQIFNSEEIEFVSAECK